MNSPKLEKAIQASLEGRLQEAGFLCDKVLSRDPANLRARGLRGILDARTGLFAEAVQKLTDVLREAPDYFEAWVWLSVSHGRLGSKVPALEAAIRAVQLRPGEGSGLNNLGLCQLAMGNLPEAAATFRQASALLPDSSEVAVNLGTALRRLGRFQEAKASFWKAVALAPNSPQSYLALGRALLAQNQLEAALACAERAVRGDTELAGARILLARALIDMGRGKSAEEHCLRAIDLEPTNETGHTLLANALATQGMHEEAALHYRKAIELKPDQGFAYYSLAFGRKLSIAEADTIAKMEALTWDQTLHRDEVKLLHYGLGRVYEDAKDFQKSMHHFDKANRIAFSQTSTRAPFSKESHVRVVDMTRKLFTQDLLATRRIGLESDLPIFIVGMMRSGTTLMEQILSRHPLVGAAGEQRFWADNARLALHPQTNTLNEEQLVQLAGEYLALLADAAPGATHVTDKMPANAAFLGFIHLAFPNARIIRMVRNPVDTCLSIYLTPNEASIDYAHNKQNIAFAFEQHMKLMEHWQSVLPTDRLMTVTYEELVTDQERITREVLEFCGLEWSDLCLSPESNERTVTTPSRWQVRQPVYTTSVERWRHFEPWIPEFVSVKGALQ